MSEMLVANISNIQHFNVHDGTGLRTTIFFQGCGLRCAWCQNPELLSMEPVMMFSEQLCTHCMACTEACPVYFPMTHLFAHTAAVARKHATFSLAHSAPTR